MARWMLCFWVRSLPAFASFSLVDDETLEAELPKPVASTTPLPLAETKPIPQSTWSARDGMTLREAVLEWAKQANWTVQWVAHDVDYPILGTLSYTGSFEQAVTGIFQAHQKVDRPLKVRGNPQQRVIIVTEKI